MPCFAARVLALGCLSLSVASSVVEKAQQQGGPTQTLPELEPKSSKKFFGKDYPSDKRPVADEHYFFDHPYPAVQDTSDFDRDFVKDENSDGGKWQAQMEYDILRQKVRQAERELEALRKRLGEEAAEMREAKAAWQEALDKLEAAKAATDAAKKVAAGANRTVKSIEDQITSSAKKVEDEMNDLEKCKKALADAKQRLKDLLEKQAAAAKKAKEVRKAKQQEKKEAQEEEEEEAEEKKAEEQKKQKEAKAKKAAKKAEEEKKKTEEEKKRAEKELKAEKQDHREDKQLKEKKQDLQEDIDDMGKKAAAWTKKLDEERAEYAEALSDYGRKVQEMQETEAELNKAAETLRKYRRPPHVDSNGGVYNVPRSLAAPAAWRWGAWAAAAFAGVAAW